MSFFGLTAFGPENFIQSSRVDSTGIYSFNVGFTLFSDEDFKTGFDKTTQLNKTEDKLNMVNVKQLFQITFNFPPLDEEVESNSIYIIYIVFTYFSGKDISDCMTWEEVMDTLNNIRSKNIYNM